LGTVSDVKLWDKIRALELAATHLGLLKKKVEHSGEIDLVKRLQARQAARQVRPRPATRAAMAHRVKQRRPPPVASFGQLADAAHVLAVRQIALER
jgi:hypothetical protein